MTIDSIKRHLLNTYSTWHQKRLEKGALPFNNHNAYYVIRRKNFEAGFFSNYIWALRHIIYAINNQMIPVVDFKNYYTPYNEFHSINGEWNSWNYYFENPIPGEDIQKAYNSKNYFMCELVSGYDYIDHHEDPFQQTEYLFSYAKKYTVIKNNLLDEYDQSMQSMGWDKNILGVHYRATDKCRDYYDGLHEKTADVDNYLRLSEKIMSMENLSRIFLATDELTVIAQFESFFGKGNILTNNVFRAENGNTGIHELQGVRRKNHRFLLGKEVLKDTYMLSKSASLICGKSNVTAAAIIWNNNMYNSINGVDLLNQQLT